MYCTTDVKGVASRPQDAKKLNAFRERGINDFVA